jgi:predicted O-linked N-acetylglucosamine transferase (SPINDLY family)
MNLGLAASLFDAACKAFEAGRIGEAEHLCRQVLAVDPGHAQALYALGLIAAQAGRPEEGLTRFDQAIAAAPGFADAHANRGVALTELNRAPEAAQAFRRALEINPGHMLAHYGLGNCLVSQGDAGGAVQAYRQALRLNPHFLDAHTNLAMALEQQGALDEAIAGFRKALALAPQSADAHYNLGVALDHAGRMDEAVPALRRALELKPDHVLAHSNLLLALTYLPGSPEDLVRAHRDFDRRQAQGLRPAAGSHPNAVDPERRLKVGYVSADFSFHPVGWLLVGPLQAHDPAEVEVFCYDAASRRDAMTDRLQAAAHHWREIGALSDAAAADLIRQDRIDILVDLSGHTGRGRPLLVARKPAPIQASWLGYPGTTGLETVDYAVMDRHSAPEGAEAWFTEALVRLPFNRFCYSPPEFAPEPAAPAREAVVFGSFNNPAKIGPEVVRLWARVLDAVPGARLVLKWKILDQPESRARIERLFAEHGVGPDRLELRGYSDYAETLGQYADVDIALDPFPFGGGFTSLDALWMGVPVVTLVQDRVAGRQTLGFLAQLGLDDLAADTEDGYVRIAAALAADPRRRAELRESLRGRMVASPLTDAKAFTPGLERAYREMWRRWCEGRPPEKMDIG